MDIKDVTEEDRYRAALEHITAGAKRASSRDGQLARDHPPSDLLVAQFMMKLTYKADMDKPDNFNFATSQIPPSYLPCILPARDLKPLMISEMRLGHHHRGHMALVHVLTPPDRMTSVMAIAEDEEGTAVLLQLYNQPEEGKASKKELLEEGRVGLVKEPFFKATVDGSYSLRVDHVSDIVWLEETDDRIPLKWMKRVLDIPGSSKEIRKQGNESVGKRNWAEAEYLYTQAIDAATTPEQGQLAHLNRSLANLRLGRSEKALSDAQKGYNDDKGDNEKALFREAKAFYSLGKFQACLDKYLAIVRDNPKNTEAWAEIKKAKQRVSEEEAGSYDFSSMYKQATATPPLIDCATYTEPVAVRDSAGRGKGLFTTRSVKAGELLLCEKAFAYCYAGQDSPVGKSNMTVLMNLSSNTMRIGGQANLITQIVQKLYHNPEAAQVLTDLHHGDYQPVGTREVDGTPVVDTFLVNKIIELNCFGAPRTSKEFVSTLRNGPDGKHRSDESASSHTTCGIWPVASRINHSCVSNCRRSFIGDMLIVRACQDIQAGAELTFGYKPQVPWESYQEAQKKLRKWGFVCSCALCLDRKSTPGSTLAQRKMLNDTLATTLKPGASAAQLARATKILQELEKTYSTARDPTSVPRMELWDPYCALGAELVRRGRAADGVELMLEGLEALGYVVVACPPRGGTSRKKTTLEIKCWGQTNDYIVVVFLKLMQAYEKLAPELCEIAREYARVAYSICYGERETIGSLDPRLL